MISENASQELIISLTLILLTAGLSGALLSKAKVPAVLAFIITGLSIGPYGLGWVTNMQLVEGIAQIGIIFLMFILGAEMNLPRLKEMRIHTIWAGVLQLGLTLAGFTLLCLYWGSPLRQALFIGGALALSSTAIVLKMLDTQNELDSVHGRIIMGILLVQDLALIPLMAFMPLLTGNISGWHALETLFWVSLKSTAFIGVAIFFSLGIIPKTIDRVAATASKEIFVVFVFAFALLMGILGEVLGLSYAVGAFVAGFSLSRGITSRQVIANSMPFRDVFSTIFFVSVGMLLDISYLVSHLALILGLTAGIMLFKTLATAASIRMLKFPLKTQLWCGLSLLQVGEFSFILLQTGHLAGTISEDILHPLTSSIVLSLIASPIILRLIPRWLEWLSRNPGFEAQMQQSFSSRASHPTSKHPPVIIAGYGPVAKNISTVLDAHYIAYSIIEMNVNTVKQLQAEGITCTYGDSASIDVLRHAGVEHAKVLAVTIPDIRSAELTVEHAKQLNPNLHCIVRSRYQHALPTLFKLGADEVVYEEFETSISFIQSIIETFDDHVSDTESYMLFLRENRKTLMNVGKGPSSDNPHYGRLSIFKETKVEWISLPGDSPHIGKTLAECDLRGKTGVNILSIIHPDGTETVNPDPKTILVGGQVLVAIGSLEQLQALEQIFYV